MTDKVASSSFSVNSEDFRMGQIEDAMRPTGRSGRSSPVNENDNNMIALFEEEGDVINNNFRKRHHDQSTPERPAVFQRTPIDDSIGKMSSYAALNYGKSAIAYRNEHFRPSGRSDFPFRQQDAEHIYRPGNEFSNPALASFTFLAEEAQESALGDEGDTPFGTDVAIALKSSTIKVIDPGVSTIPSQEEGVLERYTPRITTDLKEFSVSRGGPPHYDEATKRFLVLQRTRNSSPIREDELDADWKKWANREI